MSVKRPSYTFAAGISVISDMERVPVSSSYQLTHGTNPCDFAQVFLWLPHRDRHLVEHGRHQRDIVAITAVVDDRLSARPDIPETDRIAPLQ